MDQLNYDISTTIFIVREYYRKSNNRAICTLQMVEEVKEQNEEKRGERNLFPNHRFHYDKSQRKTEMKR